MKVANKKILTPAIAISVAVLSGTVYYGVQLSQKNNSNTTYAEVQNSVNTMTPENAPDDYVVKIPSDSLRNRIKEVLGNVNMPDSDLTFGKLKTITAINDKNPTLIDDVVFSVYPSFNAGDNLDGLQFLTNMKYIFLNNGSYKDLSPLENLTKLKSLFIANNSNITDISKLSKLSNLENLWIYNNSVKDISSVRNMSKLKFFVAFQNHIDDISPLENKPDLKIAMLETNKIKDFSPLKNAPLINLKIPTSIVKNILHFFYNLFIFCNTFS